MTDERNLPPRLLRVHFAGESMWISPTTPYTGTLENDPVFTPLKRGDTVTWRWRVNRTARMRWREWTEPSPQATST